MERDQRSYKLGLKNVKTLKMYVGKIHVMKSVVMKHNGAWLEKSQAWLEKHEKPTSLPLEHLAANLDSWIKVSTGFMSSRNELKTYMVNMFECEAINVWICVSSRGFAAAVSDETSSMC